MTPTTDGVVEVVDDGSPSTPGDMSDAPIDSEAEGPPSTVGKHKFLNFTR